MLHIWLQSRCGSVIFITVLQTVIEHFRTDKISYFLSFNYRFLSKYRLYLSPPQMSSVALSLPLAQTIVPPSLPGDQCWIGQHAEHEMELRTLKRKRGVTKKLKFSATAQALQRILSLTVWEINDKIRVCSISIFLVSICQAIKILTIFCQYPPFKSPLHRI